MFKNKTKNNGRQAENKAKQAWYLFFMATRGHKLVFARANIRMRACHYNKGEDTLGLCLTCLTVRPLFNLCLTKKVGPFLSFRSFPISPDA